MVNYILESSGSYTPNCKSLLIMLIAWKRSMLPTEGVRASHSWASWAS